MTVDLIQIKPQADFQGFADGLLRSIATALGVSYEMMAQDFTAAEESYLAHVRRRNELERQLIAERDRMLRQWLEPFYRSIRLSVISQHLIGYDPQRLLPAPEARP